MHIRGFNVFDAIFDKKLAALRYTYFLEYFYFWRINMFIGTPLKSHFARILFSRKRL